MTGFTILVPTRERAETLRYTLQTCVVQEHNDLEILVSDNASQDATRDVLSDFAERTSVSAISIQVAG